MTKAKWKRWRRRHRLNGEQKKKEKERLTAKCQANVKRKEQTKKKNKKTEQENVSTNKRMNHFVWSQPNNKKDNVKREREVGINEMERMRRRRRRRWRCLYSISLSLTTVRFLRRNPIAKFLQKERPSAWRHRFSFSLKPFYRLFSFACFEVTHTHLVVVAATKHTYASAEGLNACIKLVQFEGKKKYSYNVYSGYVSLWNLWSFCKGWNETFLNAKFLIETMWSCSDVIDLKFCVFYV